MATRRTYTEEQRAAALELAVTVGVREASRRLKVPYNTLKAWRKAAPPSPEPVPVADGADGAPDAPVAPEPARDNAGRWLPGHSGNPAGKSQAQAQAEAIAAAKAPDIIKVYADLFDDLASDDMDRRLGATVKLQSKHLLEVGDRLLNRGLGLPKARKDIEVGAKKPPRITIQIGEDPEGDDDFDEESFDDEESSAASEPDSEGDSYDYEEEACA